MKYTMDFQYMPKGAARPLDDGEVVGVSIDGDKEFGVVPNVGDFVNVLDNSDGRAAFRGRVRSRLFNYLRDQHCSIAIVVEETDDDWGKLIKE